MAQELNESTDGELTREAKHQFAVRAIAKDENLRFFVREFLSAQGALPQQSVFHPDAIVCAHNLGRQDCALQFIAMLTAQDPMLWLLLQQEEMTDVPQPV